MSPTIIVSNLAWSTPEGDVLFEGANFSLGQTVSGVVGANGAGKTTLLCLIDGSLIPPRGTVTVKGTVGVLRQDLARLDTVCISDLFGVTDALALIARIEAGQAEAEDLNDVDWLLEDRVHASLDAMGLDVALDCPTVRLSGGQAVRAGLAVLHFTAPDFILLDEPTNNLDRDGREAVFQMVDQWQKGALIVSHDRDLLERVDAIVEISNKQITTYGMAYSAYRAQKDIERAALEKTYTDGVKKRDQLEKRAQVAAERKARKDSRGKKSRAKGGQAKSLLDFEKERSEASGGANSRLREARSQAALEAVEDARARLETVEPLKMDMPATQLPPTKTVLTLESVEIAYGAASPLVRDFSMTITGPERVRLHGPNGSGKTSLLNLIMGRLEPRVGSVSVNVPVALLDQHVAVLEPTKSLVDLFRDVLPDASTNDAYATLARFRFRARDAEQLAGNLSGGERLRAGLALAMSAHPPPQLLVLDEPTNHLDLAALEALETTLVDYDGALLVVSHDEAFVDSINISRTVMLGG